MEAFNRIGNVVKKLNLTNTDEFRKIYFDLQNYILIFAKVYLTLKLRKRLRKLFT